MLSTGQCPAVRAECEGRDGWAGPLGTATALVPLPHPTGPPKPGRAGQEPAVPLRAGGVKTLCFLCLGDALWDCGGTKHRQEVREGTESLGSSGDTHPSESCWEKHSVCYWCEKNILCTPDATKTFCVQLMLYISSRALMYTGKPRAKYVFDGQPLWLPVLLKITLHSIKMLLNIKWG